MNIANLFDNPFVKSFYDAKESILYFDSLKTISEIRSYYAELRNKCILFLTNLHNYYDDNIFNLFFVVQKDTEYSIDYFDVLKREMKEKSDDIHFNEPYNFERLRKHYLKRITLISSENNMESKVYDKINFNFAKLHELMSLYYNNSTSKQFYNELKITEFTDFLYVIYKTLHLIELDDGNIFKSYEYFTNIFDGKFSNSKYFNDLIQKTELISSSSELSKFLFSLNKIEESNVCISITKKYVEIARQNNLTFDFYLNKALDVLNGIKKIRFEITHKQKADNLLNLGLIDENRYQKSVERLNQNYQSEKTDKDDYIKEFLKSNDFIKLKTDINAYNKTLNTDIIKGLSYFDLNIDRLDYDQQAEYCIAFSSNTNDKLIKKYIYVRIQSFLKSIIFFKQFDAIENAIKEFKLFDVLLKNDYKSEIHLFTFLKYCSGDDLIRRCNELAELDGKPQRYYNGGFELPLNGMTFFSVKPNPNYYEIVQAPLERLVLANKTGNLKTAEEQKAFNELWNHDLGLIDSLKKKNNNETNAFNVLSNSKDEPEKVIDFLEKYCNELLEISSKLTYVEYLDICSWVDDLTIAYVRCNKYEDAIKWFNLIYGLPERYWQRITESQKKRIEKRFIKCKKTLNLE